MDTTAASASEHPLRPYAVQPAFDSNWSSPTPTVSSRASPPSVGAYLDRYEDRALPYTAGSNGAVDATSGGLFLRSLVLGSLLTFASTALVMPFEVGKTLAQVQYVPRVSLQEYDLPAASAVDDDEELDDEGQVEAYFSDLQSRGNSTVPTLLLPPRPTSPSGYLRRAGVHDELLGTKPEWIMPVVVQGGVWDMMRTLSKWKGEGWASLWKGQLTTCIWDASAGALQPLVLSLLTALFLPTTAALSALPLIHSPRPAPLLVLATLSHVVTTVFLSPLDLVRTRLIVQSSQPQHRKYSGPLDAGTAILREEGGFYTTYLHPHLFFPAVVEGLVRPLLFLSTPLIISRALRIEPSTSPVSFALAEFVLGSAALVLTIPLETVRKRLQIQTRAPFVRGGRPGGIGRAWRTCVETRSLPYAGMVDAVYRILTEETGRIPRRRRRSSFNAQQEPTSPGPSVRETEIKEDLGPMGLGVGTGLRQLYRGLGMGIGANVVVLLLGVLVGGGEDRLRWTEM